MVCVSENGRQKALSVTRHGTGPLDTHFGEFRLYDFTVGDEWVKYAVLWKGEVDRDDMPRTSSSMLMRTDSGCETGQLFGDRTCECRQQLTLAMAEIAKAGSGLIVHIPHQDGRGKGLPFKLATLALQKELGIDTVEAARIMAQDETIDSRTYAGVVGILQFLGVTPRTCISLATNNPRKAAVFLENGYSLTDFVPVVVPPTRHTRRHLAAKQEFLGHRSLIT